MLDGDTPTAVYIPSGVAHGYLALTEIDRGRGLDVVRELIKTLEQSVTNLRGRDAALVFRDKMSPLL